MAYVPPALRRKQEAALKGKDENSNESTRQESFAPSTKHDSRSLKDIQKHFWPNWVQETPVLVRKSQDDPLGAENTNGKSDEHGNTVVGRSDHSVNQENASKQPETESSELSHSVEATIKSDTQSDVSHQAQQPARPELASLQKSSPPLTQHIEDPIQSNQGSASARDALRSNEGDNETAKRSQDVGINPPLLESIHPHNTLNSTEQSPDSLQYVLLFHDAVSYLRARQMDTE